MASVSVVDQPERTSPVVGSGAGGSGWTTPAVSEEQPGRQVTRRAPAPEYQPRR